MDRASRPPLCGTFRLACRVRSPMREVAAATKSSGKADEPDLSACCRRW
ncbi:hypothetical protein A33M_0763 [Rhodovulum sp. PH10]|nr:hypothetical protein A33M_0763 [Rhodovulum sp. PH10]